MTRRPNIVPDRLRKTIETACRNNLRADRPVTWHIDYRVDGHDSTEMLLADTPRIRATLNIDFRDIGARLHIDLSADMIDHAVATTRGAATLDAHLRQEIALALAARYLNPKGHAA